MYVSQSFMLSIKSVINIFVCRHQFWDFPCPIQIIKSNCMKNTLKTDYSCDTKLGLCIVYNYLSIYIKMFAKKIACYFARKRIEERR